MGKMRRAPRVLVMAFLPVLAVVSMSATAVAAVRRTFETASVDVSGSVRCALHPEGNTDPKQAIRVGVAADGVARFSALRPANPQDVAKLTLDCTDGQGLAHNYPVDLTRQDIFAPRPFDAVRARLDTRPALAGDPLSYSVQELIDRGYGLRPNPKANPTGYARWLRAATMPATLLQHSGAANVTQPTPEIDDTLPSVSRNGSHSANAGVTVGGSALCAGNPAGCYWTGAILNGSYRPNSNPAKATYYLANEGLFTLPTISEGGGDYAGPTEMSIWTGLDNVFQAIAFLWVTPSTAGALVVTQFHQPKSPSNPATANGASDVTFTPVLGDTIFAEEWYCDANGNPVISGGYACTYMQDLNPSNNQAWVCDKANSTTCASTWMAANDVAQGYVGEQAEYIVENDGPQDGNTYYWPDFISTPITMDGSALVVIGANTTDNLQQGGDWVTVSTDPAVRQLNDTPPTTLASSATNPDEPAHLVVTLGSNTVTWTYTPIPTTSSTGCPAGETCGHFTCPDSCGAGGCIVVPPGVGFNTTSKPVFACKSRLN
jgi:hypothetical protein